MNLIQICLRRPVGVSVGVLLTVLFGLLALFSIPVQLTPNVDVTVVTVTTRWSGANPQEIEREIVDRQEEQLRSVNGMEKMTSASRDNEATITLEFYPGVTKSDALRDVADKLRQVSGYPVEVDEPTIQAADQSVDNPIAWLILYPAPGEEERVTELYDFADDNIKPYLDRVPGVASVNIYGGKEREVQVRVDAGRLASRGLTFSDVQQALRRQNVNASAGFSSEGKRDYTVRAVGQYESLDEIRDTVIAYTPGGPVYVRDVAEVRDSFKRAFSMVRSKGTTVLAFPVRREVGTNVLTVMAGVRAAIERVNKEVLSARGMRLELTQVYDETVYINQSIAMVRNNIIYGGTLAVVVLMLFLRNWRATLAVALSIPISVIATFLVVVGAGRTLNVISLAGIAFAVGMVVDNCIVVLENIYRHRQMGKDVMTSCFDGTNEIWAAVLASTLTTMAVFIPVIFVEQEAGQLFRDISIATAAAVALSLVVAVTVTPVLASRLLRVG
ncbi:MAG: efflux RND transporter permease subunit, partial [Phycisphaerae bacterium]|nr:efflux RND transporter permease subunit [Phycisphaerae bacterium]